MKKLIALLVMLSSTACYDTDRTVVNEPLDVICKLNAVGKLPPHMIPIYHDDIVIMANPRDFDVYGPIAKEGLQYPDRLTDLEFQVFRDVTAYLPLVVEFYSSLPE